MSSEWQVYTLDKLASFKTGKLDSNAAVNGGLYPFFTCSPTTLSINNFAFDTEAVILAGNNANGVFSVKYYSGKFNAYQRTYIIEPLDAKKLSCKYLYYNIRWLIEHLGDLSIGSATKFLTKKILDNLQIRLPPKIEQERIEKTLSALDDRLALLRETNTTLESIAQTLFKSWFVDFDPVRAKMEGRQPEGMDAETAALFPDSFDESELGLVPKEWRAGKLGDIFYAKGGFAYKSNTFQYSGAPIVKIKNIVGDGTVDLENTSYIHSNQANKTNKFALQNGDIVIAMTGATIGKTGIIVIEEGKIPYLNQRVAKFESKICQLNYCWFVFVAFQNNFIFNQVLNAASGSAQANISTSGIESIRLILPCQNELLIHFTEVVTPLFFRWIENQKQIKILSNLRDTLLPRLISGQLRLPEFQEIKEKIS